MNDSTTKATPGERSRRLVETAVRVGLVVVGLAYLTSGVTIVRPGETAVLLRFERAPSGESANAVRQSGIVFAWPPPFERVVRTPSKQELRIDIDDFWPPSRPAERSGRARSSGSSAWEEVAAVADPAMALETDPADPVADDPVADEPVADDPVADDPVADEPGADDPVADEPDDLTSSGGASANESCVLTGDLHLVSIRAAVKFRIVAPLEQLRATADPAMLVRRTVAAEIQKELARSSIEEALRLRRENQGATTDLASTVRDRAQAELDRLRSGLLVTAVEVGAVGPPAEASAAFAALLTARIEQETSRDRIAAMANETLADAESLARQAVSEAKGRAELAAAEAADVDRRVRAASPGSDPAARAAAFDRLRKETWTEILRRSERIVIVPRTNVETRLSLPSGSGGGGR